MCDSVVAVGGETASGVTLFGKNSDRKAGECQPFVQFAEANHPPGSRVCCTHIEIPQVAETYRVMGHTPWWVWGFEHGVNEFAVAIGNQTVFSKEPISEIPGLIGMDLVRLGLERGRSAREALEVIAELVERHGQGGPALGPAEGGYHNSFLIADSGEAWILETSNRRWAARHARLDALSNHHSLGVDWEIGSRDLEGFARAEGLWNEAGRVDVAAAYRDERIPKHITEGRQRRALELLRAGSGQHDVASVQAVLRDHLDGGGAWRPGPTVGDEAYFTLCAHSEGVHWTAASAVAPLPPDQSVPWPVWISFGTPCSGIFLPVYVAGVIPDVFARGGAGDESCSSDREDSAWWVFYRLQRAMSADPPRHTPVLRAGWAELEERIEKARLAVELTAREAASAGDPDRAAELVSDFMAQSVADALVRAELLEASIRN